VTSVDRRSARPGRSTARARVTKDEVIAPVEREKERLLRIAHDLGERARTPVVDEWSALDVIAHLVYWQGMLARMMGAPLPPPSWVPRWQSEHEVGADELNKLTVEHYRRMPDATVLADFAFTADVVCKVVREMKEENLLLEAGAPWQPGTLVWQAISGESSGHAKEHADALEAALASGAASA
jgi:uncharacterized protein DUF1706